MQLIFPADPLNSKRVDEYFKPQAAEFVPLYGYPAIYSLEENTLSRIIEGETQVYRGWMLSGADYISLDSRVKAAGGKLLVTPEQYLNTHYLPYWYPLLTNWTAETLCVREFTAEDLPGILKALGWSRFFLKDFVKSLKTAGGSMVETPEDAPKVVELMKHYRGGLEGGLCIRKFESLHDEKRYFVANKKIFSMPVWQKETNDAILHEVVQRIDSPFYSVDIAYNENQEARVVEIGDGQVSDLVGWTPSQFSQVIRELESLTVSA